MNDRFFSDVSFYCNIKQKKNKRKTKEKKEKQKKTNDTKLFNAFIALYCHIRHPNN